MDLPPDETVRWVVRRYANLMARDGRNESARKLVLPTPQFFPDAFDGDAGSVNLLFWRLQEHSSLTDLDVELRFVDDRAAAASIGASCSSGCSSGCGPAAGAGPKTLARVRRLADGAYRADVRMSDAHSAETLTAALATSLAHIFVLETGGFDGWPEAEWMSTCELTAVMLGFGVLMANASYIYAKGCGGARVLRATSLEVNELALALALFTSLTEQRVRVTEHLGVTQRDAYNTAHEWAESNPKLIKRMRRDPGAVAADEHLEVQQAMPWLARVLGLGRKKKAEVFDEEGMQDFERSLAQRKDSAPASSHNAARIQELRALVEESLDEVRSRGTDN